MEKNQESEIQKEETIKEKSKYQSKEKEKSSSPEEEDNRKSELKDQSSERSASVRGSSGSNSYQNRSGSLLRNMHTSETDLDKIIAGKEETRLNSNSIELVDDKENQKNIESEQDNNDKNTIRNIFRRSSLRTTLSKDERRNLFKTIYEEKEKDMKFKDIVNAQLNELKENTLSYFAQIFKELENRYAEYINNVCDYIDNNEIKINKVFQQNTRSGENILEYTDNNIFIQIGNLLEIHENIFEALEDHVSLLGIFLEKPDLIQQKNPLEYFINIYSTNILNCWFMNKINFQKLNLRSFESNKDLSELFSKYLIKKKNNNLRNFSVTQDSKGNLSAGSDFIKQNLKIMEKLKFTSVKSADINKVLKFNKKDLKDEDITVSKLKSLSIIDTDFSTTTLSRIYTPSLKKFKIKHTILPLSLSGFFDAILFKSSFLVYLSLQKCFIDDEALMQCFRYLSEKPNMIESLQTISFSGNEISTVNMRYFINKNCQFKKLEVLDFSKNCIFEFGIENFKLLQNIKILDLCDNNLTNYTFFENIKNQKNINCLLFLCNNMFLTNNKNNTTRYLNYMNEKLGSYVSKIKKLNLSFLFDKVSKEKLLKLKLSPMVKISLIKLNLAYCGLDNDIVCKFLNNNFGLLNLKILNFSNNFLTLKFFELIKTIDLSLEKLTCIDLSLNDIHSLTIEDYQNIEFFINKHLNLKKIKLQETIFLQELLVLSQNEIDKIGEINKNIMSREVKFIVEKDNSLMIEPLKEIFDVKDKEV